MRVPILPVLVLLPGLVPAYAEERVERVFERNCAACHGARGAGASAGPLNDGVWKHGGDDESLVRAIRDGLPEAGMPDWGASLKPAMIQALVVYCRELEKAGRGPEPKPVGADRAVLRSRLHTYRLTPLAELPGVPWALAVQPDGRLLVTLKEGRLLSLSPDGREVTPITGLPPVWTTGQGGLLDVALPPDHATSGFVYLTLSDPDASGKKAMTVLVRGRIRENRWVDGAVLWRADARWYTGGEVHFGSRIAFDGKGAVYFTVGERGRNADEGAQSLISPYGKVIRLPLDGARAADGWVNQSVAAAELEQASCTSRYDAVFSRAVPGLWSYGHRNQQGLAFEPGTGDLYATEHGPRGGDELNLILPARNYGWPVVTHGMNYNGTPWGDGRTRQPGLEPPVAHWTPSPALCGMAFCTGDAFPAWRGDLLVGALAGQEVRRLRLRERRVVEQETLLQGRGRVRDVRCGPDGRVYVLFNGPGRLVRLDPVSEPAPAATPGAQ